MGKNSPLDITEDGYVTLAETDSMVIRNSPPKPISYAHVGLLVGPIILVPYLGWRATQYPVNLPILGITHTNSNPANICIGMLSGFIYGMEKFYRLFEIIDAWTASPQKVKEAPAETSLLKFLPIISAILAILTVNLTEQSDGGGLFNAADFSQFSSIEKSIVSALSGGFDGATMAVRLGKAADVILNRLPSKGPFQIAHTARAESSPGVELTNGDFALNNA
ncbi:MAG: hypothetical protein K0R66_425 [Gammaproteobacteria bacterium]|jgi:hypothetical protein|nr:hypothetical protein [Gammaproteobacteria bacterium]